VEVSHASGGLPNLVLESIVKYAAPDMRQMLMTRADLESNDWLLQAELLANFAQAMTLDERPSRTLGRDLNAMDSPTVASVTATSDSENEEDEATTSTTEWILDSGCVRHLTGSYNLLASNISEAQTPLHLPDGSTVKSTKRGTVTMKSEILDQTNIVGIANVGLVPELKKHFLSYMRIEQMGIRLVYEGKKRYLARASAKMVEVFESGNLLLVRFRAMDKQANTDMICSVLAEQDHPGVH
jgi:hypothetical protein